MNAAGDGLTGLSLEEFLAEVCTFRQMFGDRRVMENADRRAGIVHGLGVQYLRLTLNEADMEVAVQAFDVSMREFNTRESMMNARACT